MACNYTYFPDMQKTVGRAILEQLSSDQRRVFASWRALIILRRATFSIAKHQRRWARLPQDTSDIAPYLSEMLRKGDIARVPRLSSVYQVTAPYASKESLDEYEILMEAHPYSTLSHASALSFHELTNDLEKRFTLTVPSKIPSTLLPLGTTIEDWEGLRLPSGYKSPNIAGLPVKWSQIVNQHFFGVGEYRRFGYPLRVTDLERTLLDGLRDPGLCGGFENVLRAWVSSRDIFKVDTIIEYVARFNIQVLRQRVGFIMESMGFRDRRLEEWKGLAVRGGTSKLLGSAPYSPHDATSRFSDTWNLSLNAPIDALEGV